MFETPSKTTGLEGLQNYETSCAVSRGSPAKASFFISNHYALEGDLPNPTLSAEVNDEAVLQSRLDACQDALDRNVNMLVVDFWSIGDTLKVVQEHNEALGNVGSSP